MNGLVQFRLIIFFEILGTAKIKTYCCSYGSKLTKTATGYDCALIPNALTTKGASKGAKGTFLGNYGFCGGELGTEHGSIAAKTICCKGYIQNIERLNFC